MREGFVAIRGSDYAEFLRKKVAVLAPIVEREEAEYASWEKAFRAWEALPFWRRWFAERPRSEYAKASYAFGEWWIDKLTPASDKVDEIYDTLRGVDGRLTYYVKQHVATWLEIGE